MIDTILQGDVRSSLQQIEDASVQCCITSPPYYGLRDYGTATWEGGDPNCDHLVGRFTTPVSDKQASSVGSGTMQAADICPKCGARRIDAQIGLEPTPEAYVADLVAVFREVKRVLRDDGVLWLNLGDSYAGSGRGRNADGTWNPGKGGSKQATNIGAITGRAVNPKSFSRHLIEEGAIENARVKTLAGYKCKDLIGIPWMVAFALRADGWYLRSDIIWNKPAPMPEPVTDRCTKSHEYIFMLTKSERYYYDAEAIKEPVSEVSLRRAEYGWDCDRESTKNASMGGDGIHVETMGTRFVDPSGRNKRDVWTVPTEPCREAHFATFPPKLIDPMILAGTSEKGCCPKCGAPWERITEPVVEVRHTGETESAYPKGTTANRLALLRQAAREQGEEYTGAKKTVGWQATCDCNAGDPVPCTVLDPFMGSGTTAIECVRLHRHYLGCELNPEYVRMAERRIADMVGPLFAGGAHDE